MPNDYFTVFATFKDFIERLRAYGRANPPPKCKGLRFDIEGPLPVLDVDFLGRLVEKKSWSAKAYGVARRPSDAPLFELHVKEAKDSCRVNMRCVEPAAKDWYDETLEWLAPFDPVGGPGSDEYLLPELPSTGTTTEPLPAAPTTLPVSPGPAKKKAPRVPRRPADLRRWKAVWKKIRPLVQAGKSNNYIVGWLRQYEDDLQVSKETIARIIAAGAAGKLEETDAN